jgi:hypothetical protein
MKGCFLGRGYIEVRTDTTQQSGQTPGKKLEIKNITVYVSGYTETPDCRGKGGGGDNIPVISVSV